MARRVTRLLSLSWRIAWITWSIVVTTTLILLLAMVGYLEYRSYRQADPDQVTLMPAPDLIATGVVNPFDSNLQIELPENLGVFYATGRLPAEPGDDVRFYKNERSGVLRLGVARVSLDGGHLTWEEARRISLLKDRDKEYALRVESVEEFGILADTVTDFDQVSPDEAKSAGKKFSERINEKLKLSRKKDVFVYVHGYKVVFENPLLVAYELWHYLGYDGAFVAYAWASTPNFLAYASDLETTAYSARNLRLLLDYLARETDAERIHVVGYSAGTRLVLGTLGQMALLHANDQREQIRSLYRIENVILTNSDVDRAIFGNTIADGAWKIPGRLTVYMSQIDNTLDMARFVFQRKRVGQLVEGDRVSPEFSAFLRENQILTLVDVSRAENAAANNGHAYFHKSPWVSSDLLLMLAQNRGPGERGLHQQESGIWQFPEDYLKRLQSLPPTGDSNTD